ncbi:MAG TPA: hypothetical protein VK752_28900 [Bryobacteraceae bacterium]|jgi:peptidoglycan hydrolase CwlO-like protein|nr:hypothetical protein [Bryobacteraceae bacterium]
MSDTQRPNPFDYHRVPEPPDPNERLTQLQIELDQHTLRINHLTQQKTELQTDFDDLSKNVGDLKTTLSAYGAQIKDLETTLHGLQYFYDQKHKMVMAAIGDKKGPIDETIREFDYETVAMEDRLRELNQEVAKITVESQNATTTQAAKQAEYDKVQGYQQDLTAKLTDLNNLRNSITQSDSSTDIASMYFEVLEFQKELKSTDLIPQHQLALELKQKLGELEQAKEQARSRSAELNSLQAEQTKQQSTLSTRIAGRRAQLLTQIQNMFPAPAPIATGTTAASGATAGAPAAASSTGTTPATTK